MSPSQNDNKMTVYKTPAAERAFIDIYKKSARKFGKKTARETLRQLEEVETKLAYDPQLGKLDPEYHSDRFRYAQIKNRQKVFYEVHGDNVFIVMADYDGRDFKTLLKQMTPQIERDLIDLQKHLQQSTGRQVSHPDDAGAVLDEPAPGGKPTAPNKPRDDRGDID